MTARDHRPIPDGSHPLPARWLRVLRLLESKLSAYRVKGWLSCYADEIATDTDGRTVAPVLVAMERAGLVISFEGALRSHHAARRLWTLTKAGRSVLRDSKTATRSSREEAAA